VPPSPPDDDRVVAVYLAHRADPARSARSIGIEFGVSHHTVRSWIEQARVAEDWIVAFDRAELTTTVHGVLAELLADCLADARAAESGKERAEHRRVALGAVDRVMSLHGLRAPIRIQDERGTEPPNPGLVAKIRDAIRAGNRELQAEESAARAGETTEGKY
jgi:hypothetical protein